MDILETIVTRKRREIHALRERSDLEDWSEVARQAPAPPDFEAALRKPGRIRIIAEIKKASPSAGVLRADFDPAALARSYANAGADAISVLTDRDFFQGSIEDLATVQKTVPLPLLRKDFLLDAVQVHEAKLAGASAVLFIAECLSARELRDLVAIAKGVGLATLVELYDPQNLTAVIDSGTTIIGVNNRNLRTFHTDLRHTLDLVDRIPKDCVLVSESGIRTRADVDRLASAGVHAILVGESLLRSADPGEKLAELVV